jgi:hypothetical protein
MAIKKIKIWKNNKKALGKIFVLFFSRSSNSTLYDYKQLVRSFWYTLYRGGKLFLAPGRQIPLARPCSDVFKIINFNHLDVRESIGKRNFIQFTCFFFHFLIHSNIIFSILGYQVSKCIIAESRKSRFFNFRDSVIAVTNHISHNVFRTIVYTKKMASK